MNGEAARQGRSDDKHPALTVSAAAEQDDDRLVSLDDFPYTIACPCVIPGCTDETGCLDVRISLDDIPLHPVRGPLEDE